MNWPNFLIVGASKAGTSSIWQYLNKHPDIYLPEPKETVFFINDIYQKLNINDPGINAIKDKIICSEDEYKKLFLKKDTYRCRGEATASYLYYSEQVVPRILNLLGAETKIIIILRNPVDKVISHYKFYRGKGWETKNFDNALKNEEWRIKNRYNPFYHYTNQGFYYKKVKDFIDNFHKVHVCFYEDMRKNTQGFLNSIFDFLEVERKKIDIADQVFNKSYIPRNTAIHNLMRKLGKATAGFRNHVNFIKWEHLKTLFYNFNENKSFGISMEKYSELHSMYKPDVEQLEKLLQVNLKKKWGF